MNETMAAMIERIIREGNAKMENVPTISARIAAAVEEHIEEIIEERENSMSNCVPGGGCC